MKKGRILSLRPFHMIGLPLSFINSPPQRRDR
jgi:hypothetical protein